MGIGSFIKKQFIDVLQWNENSDGVLSWRYPMQDFEIQNGAQLIVRESQLAMFVNEGQVADVFGPGTYKLTTRTLPLLTNLKNWDKLFQSPFKSDVYFFSTRIQTARKWGTPQPITVRDADFDMVRLRAFGMYSYRVSDARKFFSEISGTRESYSREQLEGQLTGMMLPAMANALGASKVPFLDMAANQVLMAQQMEGGLRAVFEKYGLEMDEFNVASISLPEELQKAMDARIAAGMKGSLSADKMQTYTQFQTADAIPLAAQNEGGLAGIGAGLASGMVVGQAMGNAMMGQQQGMMPQQGQQTPPGQPMPAQHPGHQQVQPSAEEDIEARLEKLKRLFDKGLIDEAEYSSNKAELLKKLLG